MSYKGFALVTGAPSANNFDSNTLFTIAFGAIVFDESTGFTLPVPPDNSTGTYQSTVSNLTVSDDNESIGDAIQSNIESAFGVTLQKLIMVTGQ